MKNILLNQFLFCSWQIQLLHFMLKNIPSLLSIRLIFFKFLILGFNVGFCTFSSVFHAFCYLPCLLSICTTSCCRLLLSSILLWCGICVLTIFSGGSSSCLSWCSTWLDRLLARSMNILYLTWVRLLLLLLHFGFVFY